MASLIHIVDDDASFRTATARLLRTAGYDVVEYETAEHLLQLGDHGSEAACVLLDVRMPGVTGPELQERLLVLGSALPIVFLTGYGDIPMTVRAMKLGAEDFLTKPVDADRLFEAIERALAQYRKSRVRHDQIDALHRLIDKLTPREKEVFEHVAKGRQNKQIAYDLGATVRTIKAHRQHVMEKLHAKSVIELVSIARDLGIFVGNVGGETEED
jgi:FixJ family two-component response regulator